MINIAVVDDEEEIIKEYQRLFALYFSAIKKEYKIVVFSDGLDFIENYKSGYDILFLDIDMQKLNGLETARKLRKIDESIIIVFVTRLAQYAINGYEYHAFDFILKPLDFSTLKMKMGRILKAISNRKGKGVSIRYNGEVHIISSDEITYVESEGHKIIYHTIKGNFETLGTIKDAMKELSDYNFILSHRCCLVNAAYVTNITNDFVIVNGEKISISRLRKAEFLNYMANYI